MATVLRTTSTYCALADILAELPEYEFSDDDGEEETPEYREEREIRDELRRHQREIEEHHVAIRAAEQKCVELQKRLNELCPPYVPTSPSYSPTSPSWGASCKR